MSRVLDASPTLDDDGFDADDEFAGAPTPSRRANGVGPRSRTRSWMTATTLRAGRRPAPAMPPPIQSGRRLAGRRRSGAGRASVPRITIHVFCQRAGDGRAGRDAPPPTAAWRAPPPWSAPGGLAEALDAYRNQPTPSLIIVESREPADGAAGAASTGWPRSATPGTKVVVIGAHNDIALYRELMRRGVSEYLVPPLQPLQLIRAITGLYADPATPFVGRTVAFVGRQGRRGLLHPGAQRRLRDLPSACSANTVIVDFDLAFGTAGLDFNQDPLQGVADALSQARPSGPGAAGPDDGALHRPPEPVRRPGHAGRRLRHRRRRLSRR